MRKEPRKVRSERHRVAWFADRERKSGDDPDRRFKVASDRLLSAAKHTHRGDRAVRHVAADVADHARAAAQRADMPTASHRHNETELAAATDGRARLSVALRWLRAALAHLPAADRDAAYTHYADELIREARELTGGR